MISLNVKNVFPFSPKHNLPNYLVNRFINFHKILQQLCHNRLKIYENCQTCVIFMLLLISI